MPALRSARLTTSLPAVAAIVGGGKGCSTNTILDAPCPTLPAVSVAVRRRCSYSRRDCTDGSSRWRESDRPTPSAPAVAVLSACPRRRRVGAFASLLPRDSDTVGALADRNGVVAFDHPDDGAAGGLPVDQHCAAGAGDIADGIGRGTRCRGSSAPLKQALRRRRSRRPLTGGRRRSPPCRVRSTRRFTERAGIGRPFELDPAGIGNRHHVVAAGDRCNRSAAG